MAVCVGVKEHPGVLSHREQPGIKDSDFTKAHEN